MVEKNNYNIYKLYCIRECTDQRVFSTYFVHPLASLVMVLPVSDQPSDIHVRSVVDLRRQISVINGMARVTETAVLVDKQYVSLMLELITEQANTCMRTSMHPLICHRIYIHTCSCTCTYIKSRI